MPISHFEIPSSDGMYYMNGLDDGATVVQGNGPFAEIVGGSPFVSGFGWGSLNPINVLRTVDRYSPHSLISRRLNPRGGGSPARPPASAWRGAPAPAAPEDAAAVDPAAAAAAEAMAAETMATTEGALLGMLMNPDPNQQRIYNLQGHLRDAVHRLMTGLRSGTMALRRRGGSWRHRSHRAAAPASRRRAG